MKGSVDVAYRNKTYVAFASEDIDYYWLMLAWKKSKNIEFDFIDAHNINTARDSSLPETIRRRLGERLANTKQCIVLVSDTTRPKAARATSFLHYEIEAINRLGLPVVFSNLNKSRDVQSSKLPETLKSQYSISVSFGSTIIRHALDDFPERYAKNLRNPAPKTGPHKYLPSIYKDLGLD